MRALTEIKKVCFGYVWECGMNYFHYESENPYCEICGESKPKRLVLHHINYNEDSVTYNQFNNSDIGRIQYHAMLLNEIFSNPHNFNILCVGCHEKLEESLRLTTQKVYEEFSLFYNLKYLMNIRRLNLEKRERLQLKKEEVLTEEEVPNNWY